MIIRLCEAGDIAAIAALERECFSEPWSEASLKSELLQPYALMLVATDETAEGALLGYVSGRVIGDEGQISNVAVAEAHRREGIGRALMCEAERAFVLAGAKQLQLEVRASNLGAIALYRLLGYAAIGVRKRFYRRPTEDAVLMNKTPGEA